MTVSEKLRARRLELGMTQDDVAREAGMNMTQYNGYERGRSVPSAVTLPRIARALKTTPDRLLAPAAAADARSDGASSTLKEIRERFRKEVAQVLSLTAEDIAIRIEIVE